MAVPDTATLNAANITSNSTLDTYHYNPAPSRVHPITGYHEPLIPSEHPDSADVAPQLWAAAQKLRIEQFLEQLSGGEVNATFVANNNIENLNPHYPPYWRIQLNQGPSFVEYQYATFDAGRIAEYPTLAEETAVRMGLKEPRGWLLWPAEELFALISQWYHEVIIMDQEYQFSFDPELSKPVDLKSSDDISTRSEQTLTPKKQENRDEYMAERTRTYSTTTVSARSSSANSVNLGRYIP
jgi:hypothetical protein